MKVDIKLHEHALRLATMLVTTEAHARSLNMAEQRMLARAYIELVRRLSEGEVMEAKS